MNMQRVVFRTSIITFLLILIIPIRVISQDDKNKFIFTTRNNLVSIEAEHGNLEKSSWKEGEYYTGIGIFFYKSKASQTNPIIYTIKIKKPGIYYLHTLGNPKRKTSSSDNIILYSIFNPETKIIDSVKATFNSLNAPSWCSLTPKGGVASLKFPESGTYRLLLSASKGEGMYVDKIVMSRDPSFSPQGVGPEESCEGCEYGQREKIILPPAWAFGVLYGGYSNEKQTLDVIDTLIEGDFPIDAYWIDSYFWDFNNGDGPGGYIDFVGDTANFPDVGYLWDEFQKRDIKAGIWIWNLIQKTGNENVFNNFNERGYFSDTYTNTNGWHNETKNTLTGRINFKDPEAVEYWKSQMKPFFDKGLDFLKLDNSSEIPFCKAAFTATQELGRETKGRGFILAHLHTTYDYRLKLYPTRWTGDAKIAWSQPDYPNLYQYAMGGLRENIGMVADPKRSTYEIPFLSHDAGGYNYFGSKDQSDELYMRWIQFSSMNSIMMFFSTNDNPTRNHPYRYSMKVKNNILKYTHMRMKLFPYIYSYAIKTHITGVKMIRGDREHEYQYMLGDEILIAPVFKKGAITREIYLPNGRWIDPETGNVYEGNQTIKFDAPVEKLPLLVKEGSVIPYRNYARAIEKGTNDTLILEIYPSKQLNSFTLLEDDGLSNDYLDGKISSTEFRIEKTGNRIIFDVFPLKGNYQGMSPERCYFLRFNQSKKPRQIIINGKKTKLWDYDKTKKRIEVPMHLLKTDHTNVIVSY